MSETARWTWDGRKSGGWGICNARKAKLEGPSRNMAWGFLEPEGPKGDDRRAEQIAGARPKGCTNLLLATPK